MAYCKLKILFLTLRLQTAIAEAPVWGKRGGMQKRHFEKRLSALILDLLKFSQNFIQ